MPRFYFHLINDMNVPDDEGRELPDVEAARNWAALSVRKLAGQILKEEGRIALHHRIDIEDEWHNVVAAVQFRDVVKVED